MSYFEPYYSQPWRIKASERFACCSRPWHIKARERFTLLFSTLAYKGNGDVLLGTILFLTLVYIGKGEVQFTVLDLGV